MQLAMEANTVIGLRLLKAAAGGPAADLEAGRMISEKVSAAFDLQAQLVTAALTGAHAGAPSRAVAMYRRKVRANRRRLLKGG
ncbi:MAG: hypothetical protein EON95_19885 [Caulobacteraceae bacterium]|nr:MAG: hypothetical protein EON95_19885 [Caulobacteraceae bacterium]